MLKTKIVFKHRERFTESDKDFIKKFIDSYFRASKDIVEYYTEETVDVQ